MATGIEHTTIGWREWIALPDLNLAALKAKVDTGARTSALHAFLIEPYQQDGVDMLRFLIHPLQHNQDFEIECHTPVYDFREVTDSGGHRELRYVIQPDIVVGDHRCPIDMTLTHSQTRILRMPVGLRDVKTRCQAERGAA